MALRVSPGKTSSTGNRSEWRARNGFVYQMRRSLPLWIALCAICSMGLRAASSIVINEIHYNPDVKTEPVEFIELFNAGTNTVDLSGWYFSDGIGYNFSSGIFLAAGGYLVVAQDPAAVQSKFGVSALGPWTGTLNNEGDRIVLRDAGGGMEDEVDYQAGFPWPTVGDSPGYSIELVNPAFDNNLGANWRASAAGNPAQQSQTLIPDHAIWKYFKGLSEASSPSTAWRALNFDDSGWLSGAAPVGYDPALAMGTSLADMRSNYTTVFFRAKFVVVDPSQMGGLALEALYDDGFKVWINGANVLNVNISTGELPFDGTAGPAREDASYNRFDLNSPQSYLVPGTNLIAIQAANSSLTASSDFFLDLRLLASIGPAGHGPTRGAINSVHAGNLPPAIRRVDHSPNQPGSGKPVGITAKITDPEGVTGVTLQYQLVDPGNYIELTDAAYSNNWTSIPMNDAGTDGDALAGDSIYTAVLPGSIQTHRRLVRYRIEATDGTGLSVTVPYADDPQPNFAYFVYDGVPAWQGAVRPGVTPVANFDTNVMRRLPVIHLMARRGAVEDATWFSRYGGDLYLWAGTLIYDGKVYDHVHFRTRGGVWRYAMVKNMWKFDFNRGHDLEMRDDYGRKYKARWTKLNLGASIQQGDYGHRGEQGMFESVGFRLFNLAGVESPHTTFLQLRVIDDAAEANPADQYEGDFWGVYLAVEQEDGRFLDEHDLPDGNFYKMEGGTGELNNLGPLGPTDRSDLDAYQSGYQNTTPTDDWWRANMDLPRYYSYQVIVQGIHHYDIADGKNYFFYRNPATGLWSTHTWDIDLTWANNMYRSGTTGGDEPFKSRVLSNFANPGSRPALSTEFRNRARELRDLLWNSDQAFQLIDEHAQLLRGPTNGPTILDADRSMWDYNPKMNDGAYSSALSKAGQGRFYQWPNEPGVSKNFDGCIQLMKNYLNTRGNYLNSISSDASIPARPTITYTGPAGFPLNRLMFRSSAYSGVNVFAAMKWRIAEVTDTNAPTYDRGEPRRYEINADWESEELALFTADITIPSEATKVGHAYRVRVLMKDITGRWSNWSQPVQFVVGLPDNAAALVDNLRLTEVMYEPPGGSEFEFIELRNRSSSLTLDLDGVNFTAGVDLTFTPGTTIPPNGYLLVVNTTNFAVFRAHYGLDASVSMVGPYSGSLANGGEKLELKTGAGGSVLFSFEYSNGRGWPVAAAGGGHSLVALDPAMEGQATGALDYPGNWRASAYIGGSPGRADPVAPAATVVLNEIAAHTDYLNPSRPEYDSNDWIELFNAGATNISLSGWYLSDDPANLRKWAIPAVTIPAGGHLSFDEVNGFHNPITTGFGIDKAGEQVLLSRLPGNGQDRVEDAIKFKGQENNVSLSRVPDGGAFWYSTSRTRDGANSSALPGVVINELMYRPPDIGGTNDNTVDEYVELLNPTAETVRLQDTNGTWRLDGGVSFTTFPANTTIAAGGILLVVNFDPSDSTASNRFRNIYGITDGNVTLLGPYSGKLGNRSDRVAIEKPQYPDLPGDPYSWVILDEVIYGNQQPWPATPDGTGSALQRVAAARNGNDPANWIAAAPSPGSVSGIGPDRDGDGMPDDWEAAYSLNPDSARTWRNI
ncbi:MAG: hypothetical protein DME19_07575 [Verrucomicrobia bacterium]|nr:MAG: hypothetical protein DME19_07575 [Verrucomicrobiota bacterium]